MDRFMVSFTRLSHVVFTFGVAAVLGSLAVTACAVTIDWVTVGDPGNTADTTGDPNPAGAVADTFQIMKYEFTNAQYTDFLNAVDPDGNNPNSVYNANMGSSALSGISFTSGNAPGSKYATKSNMGDKPVNRVSWWDAARVSNWLMNGGTSSSSMETGAYTLNNATSGTAPAVNSGATFYIPTEDQWYKAAYYKGGSTNAGYWDYATQSDTAPTAVTSGSTGIGSAGGVGNFTNYAFGADWNGLDGNVTTVGTNGGASAYGAFDMSGNLFEWNDLSGAAGSSRGLRGGGWGSSAFTLSSSSRLTAAPSNENVDFGFRLASPVAVPEPSTVFSLAAGLVFGGWHVLKGRRRRTVSGVSGSLVALLLATCSVMAGTAHAITYEMVPVGNAGNANDPATGNVYGGVAYDYQIGKYDVTIGQYTAFLNAVAKTDTYSLYSASMATDLNIAGISQSGTSGAYTYSVIAPSGTTTAGASSPGNRPIVFVSWWDSARFSNWMANGQPTGAQSSTTTENGTYNVNGATSGNAPAKNVTNPNTSAAPTFFIPNENEWYKAAYLDPTLNSGAGGYYAYATQSNTAPGNIIGSGANQANYNNGVYSVTQSASYSASQNYLTDVGAFSGSGSFYGTFDQSGNVYQWNDLNGTSGSSRGLRGGDRDVTLASFLSSSIRLALDPSYEGPNVGLRLASPVPEPATLGMTSVGALCACGWWVLKRRRRMRCNRTSTAATSLALAAVFFCATNAYAQVTIDLVPVGNPGNANDTTGYGAVAYDYQIGKYDVTIGQYTTFLNAVAATDTYSLYNGSMATDLNVAGITRTGSSGSYTYSVINNGGNSANRPITYVSWFDSARFANWMANGQPTGAQSSTTTENGAYALSGTTTAPAKNVTNPNTSAVPTFFIPNESEWYKAAYFDPTLNGGAGGYYVYATQSNTAPGNIVGSGANQANYRTGSGYSVTQSGDTDANQNYLTDVGAFSGSDSFYGTFDQNGNVFQWNDLDGTTGSSRGLRGGSWFYDASLLSSSFGITADPSNGLISSGFRLASPVAVPEPSTWVSLAAGCVFGCWHVFKGRRRRTAYGVRRSRVPLLLVACSLMAGLVQADTIMMDMVTVGDPGNAGDTRTGFGAVNYEYQIGKYEVTIGQYVAFVNAVAKDDPYGLFSPSMTAGLRVPWVGGGEATCVAGISRSGLPNSFAYTAIGPTGYAPQGANSTLDRPVSFVSWFDAARFANWMSNGQPIGGPSPSTTEDGAYPLNGQVSGVVPAVNAINPNTNLSPAYCIPTTDQWYKAAYYDPALSGGTGGYHLYPTRSDDVPMNALGDAANSMNGILDFRRTVTQAEGVDSSQNYLSNVGAFTSSSSAYGTFDQGGNVQEWNDLDGLPGEWRQYRGADWSMHVDYSRSQYRRDVLASYESTYIAYDNAIGFRLATPVPIAIPEPSTYAMALSGLACGGYPFLRRRRAR